MIEVRALTKDYGKTRAVDDLTFTVRPGIVTGFLGPNGAGKSTTMRMVLGLDGPTSGTATVLGKPYRELTDPLRHVGALLDANWVHPNRSARAHLRWMARANGLPNTRVDEVLHLVGLESVAGKNAGQFSLGMKQRLGIAGALLGDPQVLLFDEPVNGLDPEGIVWIRTLMRSLAAEGRTVFVSSHLLSEMALTAEHLVVIGRGRLIADQPAAAFIEAATKSTVTVRSPRAAELAAALTAAALGVQPQADGALSVTGTAAPAAIMAQVGDLAAAAGIAVHELSTTNGSLEEAFMQLTGHSVEFAAGSDGLTGTAGPSAVALATPAAPPGAPPDSGPATPGRHAQSGGDR